MREITGKKALYKSMQDILGAAVQEVEETMKALATTEDERDMISEQMDSTMMELNATNEGLIQVKANSAPIRTFQNNLSHYIYKVKTTGLLTYDRT
jgi:vacuolar-type H+-ATPase subunit E/Vma4